MTALTLLHEALTRSGEAEPPPETPVAGVCAITGETGPCVPRKHLLAASFTDRDILARPDSPMVSAHAWTALRHKWERMACWWCDGHEFRVLKRPEVRALVIDGARASRPWAGYITTSYKKHGALRAPVNTGGRQVWRFENLTVDASDRATVADWWAKLNHWLRAGIGRPSLEAGEAAPVAIKMAGPAECLRFNAWAADKHRAPLYALLCYLLPSIEELKEEQKSQPKPEEAKPKSKPKPKKTQDDVSPYQGDLFA